MAVALQLDDDPHPVLVGLVVDPADPFDLLLGRQLGDRLDQILLVDLVGNLGDHDLRAVAGLLLLDLGPGPHDHAAAAGLIRLLDPVPPVDVGPGREIRPLDHLAELADGRFRIVHQELHRLDDLAQVVRRDVGCHTDRDAARAVDQQVGNLGGKDGGLLQPVVEVGLEIDRVLVDVLQHGHGNPGQPGLGVTVGCGGIAIDRTEIPLTVHQRIAQRELLDHAHQGVVHRAVTVRVVLAEHVAHDSGGLLIAAAGHQAQLVHGIENPPVDRLEPIANVRERARDNDAHRVVDERLLHLLFDEPGQNPFARVRCSHEVPVLER